MSSSCITNAQSSLASAEQAFLANDLHAAINLAIRASKIDPKLRVIVDRYITAYRVHLCARRRSINWYAVLDIRPIHIIPVDDVYAFEVIKSQFKIMILNLHPDHQVKSVAADGAFELVTRAWMVLGMPRYPGPGVANSAPGFWSDPHPSFWFRPRGACSGSGDLQCGDSAPSHHVM